MHWATRFVCYFLQYQSLAIKNACLSLVRNLKSRTVLLHVAYLDKIFCYLYGVEGCPLAYLVAYAPETQPVRIAQIAAYTPDEHLVFPA